MMSDYMVGLLFGLGLGSIATWTVMMFAFFRVRDYMSELLAEDWDSPEDSVYDNI